MPAVVSLQEILDALEMASSGPDVETYVDPDTGELVHVDEQTSWALARLEADEEDEEYELPDWQRELVARARAVLDSPRALRLPDSFEIHDWEIMRRFCHSVEDPDDSAVLLDAIHGRGAFRMFRSTVRRLGLEEEWYAYRGAALERIAREWLEENGVPYEEGRR